MARVKFVLARQKHVDAMLGNFRAIDKYECDSVGITADKAAQAGFEQSSVCWVGLYKNEPFCIYGVAPKSLVGTTGVPWFLATKVLDKNKLARRAVKHSTSQYVRDMMKGYELLENYVSAYNLISILWLEGNGFNTCKIEPFGLYKRPFRKFFMKKGGI